MKCNIVLCGFWSVVLSAAGLPALAGDRDTAFLHAETLAPEVVGRATACDFEFTLWDSAEGGDRVGRTLIFDGWEANRPRIKVQDGYFEAVLDFGVSPVDEESLWLEARCSCGRSAPWSTLEGRTAVTEDLLVEINTVAPRPSELRISRAQRLDLLNAPENEAGVPDGHSLDAADGDPVDALFVDNDGNVGIGTTTPRSVLEVAGDLMLDGPIRIDGDNNPLEIHVNGVRALRFEYADATSEAPNVIGGHPTNMVVSQKAGAVIAGGGSATALNRVSEDWGTVSGGRGNHAFGLLSTVGGGSGNTSSGEGSSVSGGQDNNTPGLHSTIAGGISNMADGDRGTVGGGTTNRAGGPQSTVAGGSLNVATGDYATSPGGLLNLAAGDFSFAAGRRAKANHPGSFVWADSTDADFTSTGANQFRVRADGGASFSGSLTAGSLTAGSLTTTGQASVGGTVFASAVSAGAVYAGSASVAGTLSATSLSTGHISFGSASGFTHYGPITAEKHDTFGVEDINLLRTANAFCSLSVVDFQDTAGAGERVRCLVFSWQGWWILRAEIQETGDADVLCRADCLRWD